MGKVKVLCVDDEEQNLFFFRDLLSDEFDLLTALNGEDALAVFQRVPGIAIVVADQRMPGMTGVELLARILALDRETIRIIMTGYPFIDDIIEAVNRGHIYKYFVKPLSPKKIRCSLKRAKQLYELTQEKKALLSILAEKNRLLEKRNRELKESNTILQGVINHNQQVQDEIEMNVCNNVKSILAPILAKLKDTACRDRAQYDCLVSLLEKNIETIVSALPRRLSRGLSPLTSTELQIVNYIVHGKGTKEITHILNLSPRTVETHRYNIRKKLGIKNKKVNLRSHLLTLC